MATPETTRAPRILLVEDEEKTRASIREGMVPLRKDGWNRIAQGVTSIEEVLRVTTSELEVLDE